MDPVSATLIGAGVNVLGGLFSQSSARGAYQHRYQDTVKDMEKAGLNPALAYGQNPGGGAQTHDFGDVGTQAVSAAQAAANARKTKAEAELLEGQKLELLQRARLMNAYINAGIETRKSVTDVNTARHGLMSYDLQQRKATINSDIDAALAANLQQTLQTPEARARSKYYQQLGPGAFYLNNAVDLAKAGAQLYGSRGLNKPRTTNIYPRQYR